MPDQKKGRKAKEDQKDNPAKPVKLPKFGEITKDLSQFERATYAIKAVALAEIEASIAALRRLIERGVEPARSPKLVELLLRQVELREKIAEEAAGGVAKLPTPVAVTPEATFRDSTESACGASGGTTPAPGHNIFDYGEERTVTVKIKNTGRNGTDCPFTVNLRRAPGAGPGGAPGAIKGGQKLNPGQSLTLRRKQVQVVELVCDPAPTARARCKASYTILVAPKGA
ncbi:MAG: hypothetical protein QNJ15_00905 [Erythrobacter sp.]|nr:hypothetical protein [Erythrobacter sp.]